MKNILVIQSGGRPKGNTAQLIDSFVKGVMDAGNKDAFNDLVPKIKAADCPAFASPLYFWTVSARIKAFIGRFYYLAEEYSNPPLGRYAKYPVKNCALSMTSADNFFWTFEQAIPYYQFALVNYIGLRDIGMLRAGGCGDTNGPPQIDKTEHLEQAYLFGRELY